MQCPNCNAAIPDNSQVCPQCQSTLTGASPAGELQIYYSLNNNSIGPVPQSEIYRMLVSGELSPETMIWYEGAPSWMPAKKLFAEIKTASSVSEKDIELWKKICMIMGYISLAAWIIPLLGMILSGLGLFFGCRARHTVGIILCSLTLAASLFAGIFMVYDAVDNRAHRSWQTIWVPDRDDDDDNYFSNRFHAHQFTIFDGKVLFLPADKPRKLKLIYKTKNSAKTAEGEEIPLMTHGSDTTLMPDHHARSIVVFGACMEFKSDPSHPKYKHWRSLFTDAYAQMRSQSEFVADSYPKIKLPRWARGFDRC